MDGRVYANQVFEDLALQYEGFEINKINIVLHELSWHNTLFIFL